MIIVEGKNVQHKLESGVLGSTVVITYTHNLLARFHFASVAVADSFDTSSFLGVIYQRWGSVK
jgi:hypothetical protein